MKAVLYAAPTIEPITLAELKLHLRLDSGTFSGNIDETLLIPPASHSVNTGYTLFYEILTLDVAPGGAGWAAGDTITGQTSTKTCVIVEKLTATTYTVRDRSGTFTLGEILSNGVATADQGVAYPTFTPAYVSVAGYSAVVVLEAGILTTGTIDAKIQESNDLSTWTDWTGGAFTQVTSANDQTTQEIEYTGTAAYIRVACKILVSACAFSVSVIRRAATVIEDDLLTDIIQAAREQVEDITRRALLTQTWDYYLDEFPAGDAITIPFGNLQSVTHVKYTDSDGTQTTMTVTTDYLVETNGEACGRIVLPYGEAWPSFTAYSSNPIVIRFICGWTAAASIPSKIRTAVKMICTDFYQNREGQIFGTSGSAYQVNKAVDKLLASARLWNEF